jgi:uncharacterized protein (TIGR01777 family)
LVRVVIAGGSGLIGTAVTARLEQDGAEVTRLVRRPPSGPGQVRWDPQAVDGGLDPDALSGADAVINLAGAPIAGGLWTTARRELLRASRINSTRVLAEGIAAAAKPPPVLLSGSAVGWYGETGDQEVDETAPAGRGFLADLVRDWEAAAAPAQAAGIRVVYLRSGVVLAARGGMLGPLLPLFRLGLGARLGTGQQYLSWIARTDEVAAIRFLLTADGVAGPVNVTSPAPVTNAEFTTALASAVRRPALLRVPGGLLRAGLGEASVELLGSSRVRPARLLEAGFTFRYPDIGAALNAELR